MDVAINKENVNWYIELINAYPVAGALLLFMVGFAVCYCAFWRGWVAIPGHQTKLATAVAELKYLTGYVDRLKSLLKECQDTELGYVNAMREELARLRKKNLE